MIDDEKSKCDNNNTNNNNDHGYIKVEQNCLIQKWM